MNEEIRCDETKRIARAMYGQLRRTADSADQRVWGQVVLWVESCANDDAAQDDTVQEGVILNTDIVWTLDEGVPENMTSVNLLSGDFAAVSGECLRQIGDVLGHDGEEINLDHELRDEEMIESEQRL